MLSVVRWLWHVVLDEWWHQAVECILHGVGLIDRDAHLKTPALFSFGHQDGIDHAVAGLAVEGHSGSDDGHAVRFVGDLDVVGTFEAIGSGRLSGTELAAGDGGGGVTVGIANRQVVAPGVSFGGLADVEFDIDFYARPVPGGPKRLSERGDGLAGLWVDEFSVRADFANVWASGNHLDSVPDHVRVPGGRVLLGGVLIIVPVSGHRPFPGEAEGELLAKQIGLSSVALDPFDASGLGIDVHFEELVSQQQVFGERSLGLGGLVGVVGVVGVRQPDVTAGGQIDDGSASLRRILDASQSGCIGWDGEMIVEFQGDGAWERECVDDQLSGG